MMWQRVSSEPEGQIWWAGRECTVLEDARIWVVKTKLVKGKNVNRAQNAFKLLKLTGIRLEKASLVHSCLSLPLPVHRPILNIPLGPFDYSYHQALTLHTYRLPSILHGKSHIHFPRPRAGVMPPTIIHQTQSGAVVLVDVPASIQDAQELTYTLRSAPAIDSPYPSTEPRGSKRDKALATIPFDEQLYHLSVQRRISLALAQIRADFPAKSLSWCHPRNTFAPASDSEPFEVTKEPISGASENNCRSVPAVPLLLSTTERCNKFASLNDLQRCAIRNLQSQLAIIEVADAGDFLIPPRSTFILGTLEQGLPAFTSAHQHLEKTQRFDLILLDPPWTNRSVRKSRAYKTQESQIHDPFEGALHVVGHFLAPNGLVAVWITNKSSIRTKVLEMLEVLGLHLCEEWIWIKITAQGELVTPLDGVWRRPYEILLLFRRGAASETTTTVMSPKRKIIAAVPDLHSRKPCLKTLFEDFLPPDYSALELFARNLTAGWWSWGNEVLKFQHESQWAGYRE